MPNLAERIIVPMRRRGLTLIDLLLTLVVLGLLLTIGTARVASLIDAARVRAAATSLLGALEAARGSAIRLGSGSELALLATRWEVRSVVAGDTVLSWSGVGHTGQGVLLTGAGAPIRFGGDGLAVGVANRTMVVSRGSVSRTVILSRLGRIR